MRVNEELESLFTLERRTENISLIKTVGGDNWDDVNRGTRAEGYKDESDSLVTRRLGRL